jgi:hypothetical protein
MHADDTIFEFPASTARSQSQLLRKSGIELISVELAMLILHEDGVQRQNDVNQFERVLAT